MANACNHCVANQPYRIVVGKAGFYLDKFSANCVFDFAETLSFYSRAAASLMSQIFNFSTVCSWVTDTGADTGWVGLFKKKSH